MHPDLAGRPFHAKSRYLWQPGAIRLLRERACAEFASHTVPGQVDGFSIRFPQTEVSLGLQIRARSRHIAGQELWYLVSQPAMHTTTVEVGMVALKALTLADISSASFSPISLAYRLGRGPRLVLREMLRSRLLSPVQRRELSRLVADHIWRWGGRKVLVHGDLHVSHVIVDLARRTVGFIDLEAMHVGKAATNFAQLWGGFHYADRRLGQRFYKRYRERFPEFLDAQFDTDVRVEAAIRAYSHVRVGQRQRNSDLERKGRSLLHRVLSGATFEEICLAEDA